jgi:branched-chain amino acid transport system permease protein
MAAIATTSLKDVGLGEAWAKSRVADIPHGIEQLTQLAAACAGRPSILILDEPLAGLSEGEIAEVSAILRHLKSEGVTIVVVEHQTRFVFDVCDNVTVLAAGELVKTASAAEVRADDRVREVYLGQ